MLAGHARPGDPPHGPDQQRELSLPAGLSPVRQRRLPFARPRLVTFFQLSLLFSLLTPAGRAINPTRPAYPNGQLQLASTARSVGLRSSRSEIQTPHLWSLIEQVRFNQESLAFQQGVAVGPAAGTLTIQLAPQPPGSSDRLRYRLLGFDKEWKEAGKAREILYDHLAPGHYEFDFQQAEANGLRGSVVQTIPVVVIAPFWQTASFRSLCILLLMILIVVLYKLRVSYLVKHNRRLQDTVSQTKAELTLTAKIAGDAQESLKEQALRDSLTGLWNRRAIFTMLEREIHRAQRDRFPITLVMIDLDHFKNINDTHGHLIGDDVLRETASRLTDTMRPYDFAGRYGGEEFLIVLPSCSPQNGLQRAEHFRRAIAGMPVPTCIGPLAVTCSVGVASWDEGMPPEDLIHRADEALYRAKHQGRNCVCAAVQLVGLERR